MLCIFDWDGTLSDSAAKIVSCMQAAATDVRLPVLSFERTASIIGLGLPEAVADLYPQASSSQREKVRRGYSEHYIKADVVPSSFFPGVIRGLEDLKARGYKIAVATGKTRKGLDRVLTALELQDFFHSSRCADETRSKPHPQMLNELLHEFDLQAHQAVMVGDTSFDLAMAEAIDMPRLAVSYGAHPVERLIAHRPNLLADNFSEVHQWLLDWRP